MSPTACCESRTKSNGLNVTGATSGTRTRPSNCAFSSSTTPNGSTNTTLRPIALRRSAHTKKSSPLGSISTVDPFTSPVFPAPRRFAMISDVFPVRGGAYVTAAPSSGYAASAARHPFSNAPRINPPAFDIFSNCFLAMNLLRPNTSDCARCLPVSERPNPKSSPIPTAVAKYQPKNPNVPPIQGVRRRTPSNCASTRTTASGTRNNPCQRFPPREMPHIDQYTSTTAVPIHPPPT